MTVTVNGQLRQFPEDATVSAVVASLTAVPDGRGVAVAIDGEVVPRGAWADTPLHDGARLEVLAAVQGG